MTRRIVLVVGLLVGILLLVAGLPALAGLAADWYWFDALGYEAIFLKTLGTKLLLGGGAIAVVFVFLYLNLRVAQRGLVPDPVVVTVGSGLPRVDLPRALQRLTWLIAVVLALPVGLSASGAWHTVLRFLHRVPFGDVDPVFGRDVAYYVFTLPVLSSVLGFALSLLVITLLLVVPLYVLRRDVLLSRRRVSVEPSAGWHLGALIAALFVVLAAHIYLVRIPSLLYSTTGPLFGASYTDLSVRLPVFRGLGVVALVGGAFVLLGARTGRIARHVIVATVAYLGVGLIGGAASTAVQRLVVIPNELVKESAQIERHIGATRRAWGLDAVATRDLSGESKLRMSNVEANRGTINNVRLWDRDPLLQTFGQLQEIRTYYDFVSVDDDRYWIDGEYRQVLLSPRELNSRSLPTRTFINERLTFTHGMGLTLGPVNQITQEGLPVLFVKDLPPSSSVSLEVRRPGIYYGELSNDWVFVKTRQREFDFPSGEGNAFTTYDGSGGVLAGSLLRRSLFSMYFGSLKILLSQDITSDSRILYHRNIRARAAKALPFLAWDGDPYMVITEDGRLVWILDGYTASSRYPYAQAIGDGTNYLRNSVKVLLDAYDGDVRAYIADPEDPLIRTYDRIFPGILQPLEAMPADLRAHIRYPEDLFRIQTTLYQTYHMGEPEIFYHREDEWQKPALARREGTRDPFLRHIIMKLPGEQREEYIIMTPFTPRGKDNLSAWMVARNDGDHYGQLVVYRFPRQSLVFGPTQVVNRINQDTEISRQISLWDQRGSEVIRGNLLVIPIEESLVFVQALYLRAEGGRIPELKRVIVAYENQVVMEETLERSLGRLFGGTLASTPQPGPEVRAAAAAPAPPTTASVEDLIREAADHYERAVAAQRRGDWSTYGEEMRRVGELLERLRDLTGSVP